MESTHHQQHYTSSSSSDEEEEEDHGRRRTSRLSGKWVMMGRVLIDPRAKWAQEWNRAFLLVCATGLFLDPLFFYAVSISEACMCLFVDGWFAVTVTVLRCMTDALHLWNMWLQLNMVTVERIIHCSSDGDEDDECSGKKVALRYLKSKKGFLLDLFVILPVPQVVLWVVVPSLLEKGYTTVVMTVLLIMFLFQYFPKIYHSVCFLRRMQNLSGYIFGTVWWGIALNMIAYFVAAHAAGACWYLLGLQRATKCLKEQCRATQGCTPWTLTCEQIMYYGANNLRDRSLLNWAENRHVRFMCLDSADNYEYGAYKWAVPLVTNENRLEKVLFPIFWGLMTLRF